MSDRKLTPKEQEYADMIANTDPFNVNDDIPSINYNRSKLDKHLTYIVKAFEDDGDSIKEISDLLDVDQSYLRKYLRHRKGQSWYNHNVSCHKRAAIMRETYREPITRLKAEGLTVRIIAKRLNLSVGRIDTWWMFYKRNPI